jgi:hypothetical protein
MSIFNEVQQLEELAVIGKALIKYATSIEPGLVFERQGGWWLPSIEKNFIGFRFHWSDMISITLSLYGSPDEQFKQDDLIIKTVNGRHGLCLESASTVLQGETYRDRWIETGRRGGSQTTGCDRVPRHRKSTSASIPGWPNPPNGITRSGIS